MNTEPCSRCGQVCEVAGWPRPDGPRLPALARDGNGRAVCDPCVGLETISDLTEGRPQGVYIGASRTLTTWGGSVVGRVIETRKGYRQTTWNGRLTNGVRVYGRHGDDSQHSTARRYGSARARWLADR